MFRLIRNIGCLSIIVFIIFLIVAVFFGGEKIRQLGDKTTGIVKKGFHYAADKADRIHQDIMKKINELGKPFRERDTEDKKP
ncbi:MAG: hypothetical protein ACP5KH_01665 [Thermodesulfovibrio sp.]|jgi:Sec-independent protein translocase protein TatA|uniref:Uncharacterized protein n=2 Tax=Thermodesulfovibrio TaxID=28261 RepID=A0A2J6WNQ9_9BACT|nr:MAG: hypothetical protein C0186_02340 [Thermodesulfovibrio aggregans]